LHEATLGGILTAIAITAHTLAANPAESIHARRRARAAATVHKPFTTRAAITVLARDGSASARIQAAEAIRFAGPRATPPLIRPDSNCATSQLFKIALLLLKRDAIHIRRFSPRREPRLLARP
jgi:hypothetical protein